MEITLEELQPHIIVLSEHDMGAEEVKLLKIENFEVNANFSREKFKKGGVMILSKKELKGKQVTLPKALETKILEEKMFEFCISKFSVGKFKFAVVGIYRSPSSCVETFLDRLSSLIEFLRTKFHTIIWAGDININVLIPSLDHNRLKNLLANHNMKYLIKFPTRINKNTNFNKNGKDYTETAIDNFFVNNTFKNLTNVTGCITLLSDHDGQILKFNCPEYIAKSENFLIYEHRDFSQNNLKLFAKFLEKELWVDVYNAPVADKYNIFYSTFHYYFEQSFPKRLVKKNRFKKSWITTALKEEKNELIQLSKEIRRIKNKEKDIFLKNKINNYKKKLNESKKSFFKRKIEQSTNVPKTIWNIINTETGQKKTKEVCDESFVIDIGGESHTDPKYVCNLFNDYFINVIKDNIVKPTINNSDIGNLSNDSSKNYSFFQPSFNFRPVNDAEVEHVVNSFRCKVSSGYDEVPIQVLKAGNQQLKKILAHLINSSFVSGIFPNQLKISKVVPIHKTDDKRNLANYRPVSLLPTISKIYEKLAYNQLINYLETYNLFDDIQHGFRSGRSVISAAIQFLESIIESVDKGEHVVGIFMDLSKAFDSVNHSTLIDKLNKLGIKNHSLIWFKSYLADRVQYVEIQQTNARKRKLKFHSEPKFIKYGVPQGSILGPLLFICYLKDMAQILSFPQHSLCLYADDSNLKISANTIDELETQSNIELENVEKFLNNLNLQVNVKKTNYVYFKTQQSKVSNEPNIMFNNQAVERNKNIKFLGLLIDENLKWNEHVNKLLKKLNSGVYALSRMVFLNDCSTLRMIYFAHIHSHIKYGLALYGSTKKSNLDEILKIQKKSIRIIKNLDKDTSARPHFTDLKILTVYGQYIFDTIELVKNSTIILDPPRHRYNTRRGTEIVSNHHRLKFYEKKPLYTGQKFLKCIPIQIKQEKSVKTFCKKLKEHLIKNPVYSFDEFFMLA